MKGANIGNGPDSPGSGNTVPLCLSGWELAVAKAAEYNRWNVQA